MPPAILKESPICVTDALDHVPENNVVPAEIPAAATSPTSWMVPPESKNHCVELDAVRLPVAKESTTNKGTRSARMTSPTALRAPGA